jgi:hypothetical protein
MHCRFLVYVGNMRILTGFKYTENFDGFNEKVKNINLECLRIIHKIPIT